MKIEDVLTSVEVVTEIRVALQAMLEFWNKKRDIEKAVLAKVKGISEDDIELDDLFEELGAAGFCPDDAEIPLKCAIRNHCETL